MRQRQKPADLPAIAPRLRQPPQLRRREAVPQTDRRRHRNLPRKGMLNHISGLLGIARVSQASRLLVLGVIRPSELTLTALMATASHMLRLTDVTSRMMTASIGKARFATEGPIPRSDYVAITQG